MRNRFLLLATGLLLTLSACQQTVTPETSAPGVLGMGTITVGLAVSPPHL